MAYFYDEPSHTFSEYLLIPGYTAKDCIPANVSLRTPVVRFARGEQSPVMLNIPLVSAIMQAVSDDRMAIALAREGGLAFLYASQPVEQQAEMVRRVKAHKAGFVASDSNLRPDDTLSCVLALKARTGHSTMAVTEDGSATGRLLGIVTSRDYRVSRMAPDTPVRTFMTPFDRLVFAREGTSLKEANDIIWEHKLNALPIVAKDGRLVAFVFRKDYDAHKENPLELLDAKKRYLVGAGINTRDYEARVPALVDAGADVLCIDSSEGYSEWQKETLAFIRARYGSEVRVGAGERRGPGGLPLPGRGGGGLCQGRHRRRLHLHHARDQGHRPRAGHRGDRGRPRARRIFRGDGRVRAHLFRRRHRAGLPHHARARHGRGFLHAGPVFRPL